MQTPKGYGSGERLGQFMDPSNPTKLSEGKRFKFREWQGLGNAAQISVEVNRDTAITAAFDIEPRQTQTVDFTKFVRNALSKTGDM